MGLNEPAARELTEDEATTSCELVGDDRSDACDRLAKVTRLATSDNETKICIGYGEY